MQCNDVQARLDQYLDGELTLSDERTLEAHIEHCEACQQRLAEHEILRSVVREAAMSPVPTSLRRCIENGMQDMQSGTVKKSSHWLPVFGGMIAASVLTVVVMVGIGQPGQADLDPYLDAHVRSLMVDHVVDIESTNKHNVKPWFNGKLDFAPPVHEIEMPDLKLIGGRIDYIANRPAAAIVYRIRAHLINVIVQRSKATEEETMPILIQQSGYNYVEWHSHGLYFRIISDLNRGELEKFSHSYYMKS